MENECDCFSCSQYRNWDRIDFLKKNKKSSIESGISSVTLSFEASIGRLPDEVLIRVLKKISPNNINNFLTVVGLEMVSKRFRRCMVKANKKIWANVTELVLGFDPDLPDSQYLRHIGHYSLFPFLQRVPNITKVTIDFADNWLCPEMMKKYVFPVVDRFAEKFKIQQMISHEVQENVGESLVCNLIKVSVQSLEIFNFNVVGTTFDKIGSALTDCPQLKNLKVSLVDWVDGSFHGDVSMFARAICKLRQLESLEMSHFPERYTRYFIVNVYFAVACSRLKSVHFTNPQVVATHPDEPVTFERVRLYLGMSHSLSYDSFREFEFHYCPHSDDLSQLPNLLSKAQLSHLKITFHPYFEFHKTAKIIQLFENTQVKNEEMKISITFLHSEVDYEAKLAIIHHLLDEFDVPHGNGQENVWEFIRDRLTVNLKLNKIQDESLICHPQPPPHNAQSINLKGKSLF